MKPLLCLVCVGRYGLGSNNSISKYIPVDKQKELEEIFDICVLTDDGSLKKRNLISNSGFFDVEIYTSKIFSYFAKLTFSIRMALKHKRGAYYCDINKLYELANIDVTDKYKFTYIREWPKLTYFSQMENEIYWRKLVWFWIERGYDYKQLKTIEEHCFYMPFHKQNEKLLHTIEEIKPVFEYLSITHENKYSDRGIGNGEGLALSYALDVCNMNK